jgi:decaprenyl-phosphate phosphoribosyltransferase
MATNTARERHAAAQHEPISMSMGGALLRTARPRQWSKNLLVAAAPAAAGVLGDGAIAARVLLAFVVFCLAASGVYYINDAIDAATDERHPRKRRRPVAAGRVPVPLAVGIGVGLFAAALGLSLVARQPLFAFIVGLYLALNVAYSVKLKHVPLLDIVIVASGFVIRAMAGGFATGLPLSEWFLIVASFGALFVVTGKRHAEVATLLSHSVSHRPTLSAYTPDYTQHILSVTAGITMVAYSLWAFEIQDASPGGVWLTLSILPFVVGVLRYSMLVFAGQGGEPEDILLRDRGLQAAGALWALLFALGIYLA